MTADLAEARGPDVACSIEVPVAWFEAGATLQIQLPRLMTCARCEGGGCDACQRRGAFEQQSAGFAREVAVVLPKQAAASCAPVKLRLPALGARAPLPAAVAPPEVAVAPREEPAVAAAEPPSVAAPAAPAGVPAAPVALPAAPVAVPTAPGVAALPAIAALPAALPAATAALPAVSAPRALAALPAAPLAPSAPPALAALPPAIAALPAALEPAPIARAEAPPAAETPAPPAAAEPPVAESQSAPQAPPGLPPGHLLLTVIPRAPEPGWTPPSNVQALVLAQPERSVWAWLRPLELLLFPDRLVAALTSWGQSRSRVVWLCAALAVLVLTLSGFWLLTRSGSRSQ